MRILEFDNYLLIKTILDIFYKYHRARSAKSSIVKYEGE